MKTELVSVSHIFGMNETSGAQIRVPKESSINTPVRNDDYIFEKNLLTRLILWYTQGSDEIGLHLYGQTGAGKSSLARELASRVRTGLHELHATPETEVADLIGGYILQEGNTVWVNGPLTAAAEAGEWLLIDELDVLNPGVGMILKSVLDGGPVSIPQTGQLLQPQPGFRLIATSNTDGSGDTSGRYRGTQQQNTAVMNCFSHFRVNYLEAENETNLLMKLVPGIPKEVTATLVNVANAVRTAFMGEDSILNTVLSTRELMRTMRYFSSLAQRRETSIYEDVTCALQMAVGDSDMNVLSEIVQRYFPAEEGGAR